MVGGKRRRSADKRVLGSHQKCWLYGRHAVLETLRAARWRPLEIWLANDLEPAIRNEVSALAGQQQVPLVESDADAMTKRCGGLAHQGLMARMPPFPYAKINEVLERAAQPAFFVILDGIQDPFNFGAILRSADVFGVAGVFVPADNQSEVTVQVVRSSAGAVNHIPIAQVQNLVELLAQLRERGVHSIAASGTASTTVTECDLTAACALVIGNEGAGVRTDVLAACDLQVKIPQAGHVDSLNAAVAAGILCYEVQRQRQAQQYDR
jgi:23S rRNA (guanosine2251-2'-O)-methyltransferase